VRERARPEPSGGQRVSGSGRQWHAGAHARAAALGALDLQRPARGRKAIGKSAQPGAGGRAGAAHAVVGDLGDHRVVADLDVERHVGRSRVLGDVGERLGGHEVGRRLHAGGRRCSGTRTSTGTGDRAASTLERRGQSMVPDQSGVDAARELAWLGERPADLIERLDNERLRRRPAGPRRGPVQRQ